MELLDSRFTCLSSVNFLFMFYIIISFEGEEGLVTEGICCKELVVFLIINPGSNNDCMQCCLSLHSGSGVQT